MAACQRVHTQCVQGLGRVGLTDSRTSMVLSMSSELNANRCHRDPGWHGVRSTPAGVVMNPDRRGLARRR